MVLTMAGLVKANGPSRWWSMPCWTTTDEVLVATEVDGMRLADFAERGIAAGLRPTVAVEVGEQAVVAVAMDVDRTGEGGLGKHGFHFGPAPVPAPAPQEVELALT
jgi:hypothetical protein